ncbi:hypothetical protein [Flavobacterium phycosphaerae]|uniref:hypothetical protein n=1 Tax=Flavobacterium phycosphaerae TaxID=2697515 RepID=UPI00138B0388|nr:hypothetical protein [Flavobacterium phycosphaerae]
MKNYITLCFLVAFITSATPQESRFCHLVSTETTDCPTDSNTLKSVKSYYYFPNMQVYYDIEKKMYHYQLNKEWVISEELPLYYGGYSLFKNERVLVTIANGDAPQTYIKTHRKEFPYNPKGRIKRPAQILAENETALIQ